MCTNKIKEMLRKIFLLICMLAFLTGGMVGNAMAVNLNNNKSNHSEEPPEWVLIASNANGKVYIDVNNLMIQGKIAVAETKVEPSNGTQATYVLQVVSRDTKRMAILTVRTSEKVVFAVDENLTNLKWVSIKPKSTFESMYYYLWPYKLSTK